MDTSDFTNYSLTVLPTPIRPQILTFCSNSDMHFNADDPRICQGIQLFNSREFFACHDVFEDLWSELVTREKVCFQGLIHAAVCLFHFEGGNLAGARKMYGSFRAYTGEFVPEFCGIHIQKLRDDMEQCFAELMAVPSGSPYPKNVQLNPSLIPTIHRYGATTGNSQASH